MEHDGGIETERKRERARTPTGMKRMQKQRPQNKPKITFYLLNCYSLSFFLLHSFVCLLVCCWKFRCRYRYSVLLMFVDCRLLLLCCLYSCTYLHIVMACCSVRYYLLYLTFWWRCPFFLAIWCSCSASLIESDMICVCVCAAYEWEYEQEELTNLITTFILWLLLFNTAIHCIASIYTLIKHVNLIMLWYTFIASNLMRDAG